jgi:hypothetical protein
VTQKRGEGEPIQLEAHSWAESLARRVSTRTLIVFWILLGLPLVLVVRSFWQSDAESTSQRVGEAFVLIVFGLILYGITARYIRLRRAAREPERGAS